MTTKIDLDTKAIEVVAKGLFTGGLTMLGANLLFGGAEPMLGPLSPALVMGTVAGISQMGATAIALYSVDEGERNLYLQPALTVGLSTAALYMLGRKQITKKMTYAMYAGTVGAVSLGAEPAFIFFMTAAGMLMAIAGIETDTLRHAFIWDISI